MHCGYAVLSASCQCAAHPLLTSPGTLNPLRRYVYDRKEYVWPSVQELSRDSGGTVPRHLLSVMETFLLGFSGICNFNYKLR